MNNQITNNDRDVIGDFVELRFTNLPSSSFIRGKVDTGATICSLHCDGHEINEKTNQITFRSSHLSKNNITVPLSDRQAVKTADNGTEYRPVIEMDVKIGEKIIEKVKFNLNNRSNMDSPILIGQNLIKAGNFLIDPTQVSEATKPERLPDEDVDIDAESVLDSVVDSIKSEQDGIDDLDTEELDDLELDDTDMTDARREEIDHVYQSMRKSNITLEELFKYAESYISKWTDPPSK